MSAERKIVTTDAPRCPSCKSTRREEYTNKQVQQFAGLLPDGTPYSAIIRRNTKCLDCGQARIDRTYEFQPAKAKGTKGDPS